VLKGTFRASDARKVPFSASLAGVSASYYVRLEQTLTLAHAPEQTLVVVTAEPGSSSQAALTLLNAATAAPAGQPRPAPAVS
jgi:hypothetical protein